MMIFREVTRLAALVVPFALVSTALASASGAAPAEPVPVKTKPTVTEVAPTAHGAWFGWSQNSEAKPDHFDFYVQRGTGARVKVNAPKTQGVDGAIVGHRVYYAQQLGDRAPRINRFDLRTGHRTPLLAKVKGRLSPVVGEDVSVSWPWLLYSGYARSSFGGDRTVMLYNLVTRKLRTVSSRAMDLNELYARQVNGAYLTFRNYNYADEPAYVVYRYNIETKQYESLRPSEESFGQGEPAVSSDGSVYYFQSDCSGYPCPEELVRHPVGGPGEVVASLTAEDDESFPVVRFVKDRPDGSRVVYLTLGGDDIYKVVDDSQAAAARR